MAVLLRRLFGLRSISALEYNQFRASFYRKQVCFAAERNLFFSHNGDMLPCCFNREFVFGDVDSQKIPGVLSGERRRTLAEKLRNNDFSSGCEVCHKKIETCDYRSIGARVYDFFHAPTNPMPLIMEFELSQNCNLDCIMCPPELHAHSRSTVYNEEFLDGLKPYLLKLKKARFFGGEPFLIQEYYAIWDFLITNNKTCLNLVQTNGTVLSQRIKDILTNGNFALSISVDSLQKEMYEKIRAGAHFEQFQENLNWFFDHTKRKKTYINFAICPMTVNAKEIPEIVRFANNLGARVNFNTVDFPKTLSLKHLPSSELKEIILLYKTEEFKSRNSVARYNAQHFRSLISRIEGYFRDAISNEQEVRVSFTKAELLELLQRKLPHTAEDALLDKLKLAVDGLKMEIKLRETDVLQINSVESLVFEAWVAGNANAALIEKFSAIILYGFQEM